MSKSEFYIRGHWELRFVKNFIKNILFGKHRVGIYKIRFGFAKGLLMYIDTNSNSQAILGTREREIQDYFKCFALQCDYFFDIGAPDGYYSLIYRRLNRGGKIFICDINTEYNELQKGNFNLNGFSFEENVSRFNQPISNADNSRVDDLINVKNKKIFFKIDVDGAELEVLNGGMRTFRDNPCYFIIETHTLGLEKECIRLLKDMGYVVRIIKPLWWRIFLCERRPSAHNRWFVAQRPSQKITTVCLGSCIE